jgi:hypothetical protein
MTTCDRCQRQTDETVDVWVQGYRHEADDDYDRTHSVTFGDVDLGGCDYVTLCVDCWKHCVLPAWKALLSASRVLGH